MNAKDRKIEPLERLVAELMQRVDLLERKLAAARKDSSSSSKPPSSDIVKKPTGKAGGKDKRFWIGCFRADLFTLFWIDRSRGSQVLYEVLGADFDGILGGDYFSAYRKYMRDFDLRVQFCLAHLIRDVKYLMTLSDKPTKAYGQRLLDSIREMFHTFHRRDELTEQTVQVVAPTGHW